MLSAAKVMERFRSALTRNSADGRIQRQGVIVKCLKRLRSDQVATTAYLFKIAQNSYPSLFRDGSLERFKNDLFQLKAEHKITDNRIGYWKLLP